MPTWSKIRNQYHYHYIIHFSICDEENRRRRLFWTERIFFINVVPKSSKYYLSGLNLGLKFPCRNTRSSKYRSTISIPVGNVRAVRNKYINRSLIKGDDDNSRVLNKYLFLLIIFMASSKLSAWWWLKKNRKTRYQHLTQIGFDNQFTNNYVFLFSYKTNKIPRMK
jgi:hypothetical protein